MSDTVELQAQIMIGPDHKYNIGDDFFKRRLIDQLVDYIVKNELAQFDFSDPMMKRVSMRAVRPHRG